MIVLVAALVSAACVAASARRLALVHHAAELDTQALHRALLGNAGRARFPALRTALLAEQPRSWVGTVCASLERGGVEGAAEVNEELRELDWRMVRWARVPRVSASIASSAGFLLASLALRVGLSQASGSPDGAVGDALHGVLADTLGVAAFGMTGAVWCIALQRRALQAQRALAAGADRLVERIEALTGAVTGAPAAEPEPSSPT